MKNIKSHFRFTKNDRNGIFVLILLITGIQLVYFGVHFTKETEVYNKEASLYLQSKLDSIRLLQESKELIIHPFNPNYISDYKGYQLGLSVEQIDKLVAFRAMGEFVNSANDFQRVTGVSDSLLQIIAPYFKFPEWVTNKTKVPKEEKVTENLSVVAPVSVIKDINWASEEDLKSIQGIGDVYAQRIVAYRDKLGGFLVNDQLFEVWGIDKITIEKVLNVFQVVEVPEVLKVNLNTVSLKVLSQNPYIDYATSRRVLIYRSKVGEISSFDELADVEGVSELLLLRFPFYFYLEN